MCTWKRDHQSIEFLYFVLATVFVGWESKGSVERDSECRHMFSPLQIWSLTLRTTSAYTSTPVEPAQAYYVSVFGDKKDQKLDKRH